MADVVIISGSGPYADLWHPFPATSTRLAELVVALGHQVTVSDQVEKALLSLGEPDLLVINIGNPRPARPPSIMNEIQDVLLGHLARGGAVLAMHASATSFTTMPRWPELLGGRWVRGTTMHPPLDLARIRLHPHRHPVVTGLSRVEVWDERYSYLKVFDDVTILGDHTYDGLDHPMIWAREAGPGRVVYDGLGHDARSFDSAAHRELLRRSVRWLLREPLT